NGSRTVDMNNPTCGDRIRLTFDIEDGIIKDAKFEGEGCSISMASASMMTQAVKGHSLGEAMQMSQEFTKMMLGEVTPESIRLRKKILNKNVREKEAKRIKQMMQENE
ncbi:Fe-S cluster assembly sulfur transfer protein SufU, partial [Staphylococcus aureus]|uniref:Fe-S cluster assembly sulfur transfer protein SufU n=1 Tax=Staphylococcus aureus TaxID=1280 RepID=UPI00272DFE08